MSNVVDMLQVEQSIFFLFKNGDVFLKDFEENKYSKIWLTHIIQMRQLVTYIDPMGYECSSVVFLLDRHGQLYSYTSYMGFTGEPVHLPQYNNITYLSHNRVFYGVNGEKYIIAYFMEKNTKLPNVPEM